MDIVDWLLFISFLVLAFNIIRINRDILLINQNMEIIEKNVEVMDKFFKNSLGANFVINSLLKKNGQKKTFKS